MAWSSKKVQQKMAAGPTTTKAPSAPPAAVASDAPSTSAGGTGFEDSAISSRVHAQPLQPASTSTAPTKFDHSEATDCLSNVWYSYAENSAAVTYEPKKEKWAKSTTFDFAQAIAAAH